MKCYETEPSCYMRSYEDLIFQGSWQVGMGIDSKTKWKENWEAVERGARQEKVMHLEMLLDAPILYCINMLCK